MQTPSAARIKGWSLLGNNRFHDHEHDEQCEQNERLDQSESNDHHRLNRTGSTGVAGSAFSGTCTDKTLTKPQQASQKIDI